MTRIVLEMIHFHEERKINHEIKEMFISDSGYTSHRVNILRDTTNPRDVKTAVKIGNKKTMMGSL